MSEPVYYNLWYDSGGRWTTNSFKSRAQDYRNPLKLSRKEAEEFLIEQKGSASCFSIRAINPDKPSERLSDEALKAIEKLQASEERPMTMATLKSFRLGDQVLVSLDANGHITNQPGRMITATIIGSNPNQTILGWKDSSFAPSNALPRMKSATNTYYSSEGEYQLALGVQPNTACSATSVPKPDVIGSARLGDVVRIYLDADNNIVDFPTSTTIGGTVIGRIEGKTLIGWKAGEQKPANVASSRAQKSTVQYIEGEGSFEAGYEAPNLMACVLPAIRQNAEISTLKSENNKLKSELDDVRRKLDKANDAAMPRAITVSSNIKHGQKVRWCNRCTGRYIEIEIVANGYTKMRGYVMLDEGLDCVGVSTTFARAQALIKVASEFGFAINDDLTNLSVYNDGDCVALEEPVKPKATEHKFQTADRVSFTSPNYGRSYGTILVVDGEVWVLLDDPILYGTWDTWLEGSVCKRGRKVASSIGLTIDDVRRIHTWPDTTQMTLLDDQAIPRPTIKAAEPAIVPAEAIKQAEETPEATKSDGMGIGMIAGLTAVGAMVSAFSKSNTPTETVRVSAPPAINDATPAMFEAAEAMAN